METKFEQNIQKLHLKLNLIKIYYAQITKEIIT